MEICSICNTRYEKDIPHYCKKCGKNLSDQIEKTDVLLFISKFLKVIGFLNLFLFSFPMTSCAINPMCIDGACFGDNYSIFDWIFICMPVVFIFFGFILKKQFKKMCLLNIKK